MLADSFGRVATDLRVSLTDRCNLRCAYCMPPEGLDWLPGSQVLTDGELARLGQVPLARSVHPGLAARSFAFDPSGEFLLVADRPANLIRSYAADGASGELRPLAEAAVPGPAFVAFAGLPG